jgi:hypothetical protein
LLYARHVRSNPIRYIDPSGRYLCETADSSCDQVNVYLHESFGIIVGGTISEEEKWELAYAAELDGKKWQAEGKGNSPEEAFRAMHDPLEIRIDPGADLKGNCEFKQGVLRCKDAPTIPNSIHEFGHVFDVHFEEGPTDRIPEGVRSTEGLVCHPLDDCLENTFTLDEDSRVARYEETADYYMNWVLDGVPGYEEYSLTSDLIEMYGDLSRDDWWYWNIVENYP